MKGFRSLGKKPKAPPLTAFDHIRTYRQYSFLTEENKETMWMDWCKLNNKDPEQDGIADEFFASLDALEQENELDTIIDLDKLDENNTN